MQPIIKTDDIPPKKIVSENILTDPKTKEKTKDTEQYENTNMKDDYSSKVVPTIISGPKIDGYIFTLQNHELKNLVKKRVRLPKRYSTIIENRKRKNNVVKSIKKVICPTYKSVLFEPL